jgi:hypothetical protein
MRPDLGLSGGEGRRKEESRDEEAVGVAHQKRQDGGWASGGGSRKGRSVRELY